MCDLVIVCPNTNQRFELEITGNDGLSGTWQVKESIIEEALAQLLLDLEMLQDGSWQPDTPSVQASIDNIYRIAEELNIDLEVSPDEN